MIKTNVEINEMKDLPPIFFKKLTKTQRRDIIKEKRIVLLRFIATRYYIMHNPKNKLANNWPMFNEEMDSNLFLGRDLFQKMISHMLLRLNMTEEINIRLNRYVQSGRHVSLDEKHKGCKKDKYLSRWIHGKDPNWGH